MINKFNDWLMDQVSTVLSSPWLFYGFVVIIVVILFLSPPTSLFQALVDFFSIIVQSVGLIVINNTAMRSGKVTSREAGETRKLIQDMHDIQLQEHDETRKILNYVQSLVIEIHGDVHGNDSKENE